MRPVEWSPHESYLRKLERLGFALIRTRSLKEPVTPSNDNRGRNLWIQKSVGLAGPFALALLVAIPYVAENSSGPIIVASLLLSAVAASLTVWCYTDFEKNHGHCSGDLFTCLFTCVGEFPAFLAGWWWIQAQASAFAACARTLSSIMESVTGHHMEKLMENILGAFTPLGAPVDLLAVGVTAVPTIMCSLGMEESGFLRLALFLLTTLTSLTIFGSALASSHLFPSVVDQIPIIPSLDRNLYSKILSGASLASIGFLGLYSTCNPDNLTLTQHQHFQVIKRFSLTGCVLLTGCFTVYFIESTVLNKVQQTVFYLKITLWDGDPPILWPLEGGWRLAVASLAIAALAIATFEFLIPLSTAVTKLANDGLLYRNLRKTVTSESSTKWNSMTPLVFGGVSAIQALTLDTKVLLGLSASSLLCIHIIICSSMLALRYQTRSCSSSSSVAHKRSGHIRTRPRNRSAGLSTPSQGTRRMLTVSFLKSGLSKIPRDVTDEIDIDASRSSGAGSHSGNISDRTFLMDDVGIEPIEPRESTSDFSMGSGVSGYESDSDPCDRSETTDDTDIDAVVTEYQQTMNILTLNGLMPMHPTPATGRRVALATVALIPCCIALAASMNRAPMPKTTPPIGLLSSIMLAASSGLLTFLLLVVISRQPQRKQRCSPSRSSSSSSSLPTAASASVSASTPTAAVSPPPPPCSSSSSSSSPPSPPHPSSSATTGSNSNLHNDAESSSTSHFFQYSIVPWLPAAAIFLHCCLLLEALDLSGSPFAIWLAVGLVIYFSYGVVKSIAAPALIIPNNNERVRLSGNNSVSRNSVVGNDPSSTSTSEHFGDMDQVLIS